VQLARIGDPGRERPSVRVGDDAYVDVADVAGDFDEAFFGAGGAALLEDAVSARVAAGQVEPLDGRRLGAPIARPHQILCIGLNYSDHAAETGQPVPDEPILFTKSPNTLIGPHDDVRVPRGSTKLDWEVELGVVIGRRAQYLDGPGAAMEHIAGFVLVDDLSERAFQLEESGGQWSKGKIAPGFCPTGPWLVTPDELDHRDLRLRSWVGGQPRQDSSTKDMIFDVEHLVHHLSQYTALEPGDLVLTGTPEGVALSGRFPYLRPGDVVEVEIDGLGRQRHALVASGGPA
jgi:2-keto-4-pentenoate hydratase/2-oxohepta-3-ene-1,7-dioic acid hydratase in catechol pathway